MITQADRLKLQEDLASLSHREAENLPNQEIQRKFLPLASHRLALRPETVVVLGGRGAGKSALFKLIKSFSQPGELKDFFDDSMIPDAQWLDAFSQSIEHPDVGVFDDMAGNLSDSELRTFWHVYLLRRIQDLPKMKLPIRGELLAFLKVTPTSWHGWALECRHWLNEASQALDALEKSLEQRKTYLFAAYDHLDRIGGFDSEIRRRSASTLLALWLSLSNRYRFLRAKIFIREDLFDAGQLGFPDASKLRPRSVSIEWDVASLYQVAVRHLANTSEQMRDWLRQVARLDLEDRGSLGWMPGPMSLRKQEEFASRLAGETMGKGPKKGYTYRWIPNRLQDAQGRIVPRSMLYLLGIAGEKAKSNGPNRGNKLISSSNLIESLEKTSIERVGEIQEEYLLVKKIEMLKGLKVPALYKEVRDRLGGNQEADGILHELLRLGVLAERQSDKFQKIDVPDIYRYGYGILRKGGVKRPK